MIKNYVLLLFISILGLSFCVNQEALAVDLTLPQFARVVVKSYFENKSLNYKDLKLINEDTNKIRGIFVTIVDSNNRSRGCWGSLQIQSNLKDAITSAAMGAVKHDYRYKPLKKNDLASVKFQVSVVIQVIPVESVREINPLKDGLLVQSGSKGGILMPGEAIDPYYQMVQCKLKANIKPGEPCNLFKLVTRIYKE